MKKGVRIINCARGGIVDEAALADALKSGKVAGAALDVFVEEPPPADHPLLHLDSVIATPHLGAATDEAQVQVSVDIAHQVAEFLIDGTIRQAVNIPALSTKELEILGPHLTLGEKLGRLAAQLITDAPTQVDAGVWRRSGESQARRDHRGGSEGIDERLPRRGFELRQRAVHRARTRNQHYRNALARSHRLRQHPDAHGSHRRRRA